MKKILFSVMVVLALGAAVPVSAAPITGIMNITGSVIVSAGNIDWYPPEGPIDGKFSTNSPGTQYFNHIFSGDPGAPYTGRSLDLSGAPAAVPNFLNTFNAPGYENLHFDLTNFLPPGGTPCVPGHDYSLNEQCSLGVFLVTQGNNAVSVRMEISGHFVDLSFGDNGTMNVGTGIYTTQGDLLIRETQGTVHTIRQLVEAIDRGQHIDSSYSASYTATAVPEPATLLTFGLGTAALAAHRRRKAKKESKG